MSSSGIKEQRHHLNQEEKKKTKEGTTTKRWDYAGSDTGVNVSVIPLDPIAHASTHWWYRSKPLLPPLYLDRQPQLWTRAPSSCRDLEKFTSYLQWRAPPHTPPTPHPPSFFILRTCDIRALLIACLLPADRSTENSEVLVECRCLLPKGRTQHFKYQTYFQTCNDRGEDNNLKKKGWRQIQKLRLQTTGEDDEACSGVRVENTTYSGLTSV